MKDAILQNNAALAEIYTNNMIKQAELALEGAMYKNQLLIDLTNRKQEIKDSAWQKQMAMLEQMNTENAMKWDIESYYDNQAWQTEQAQLDRDLQTALENLNHKHQLERDKINNDFTAKQNELNRQHDIKLEGIRDENERKQIELQHKKDMEKLKKQQEYALAQLDKELANEKALLSYQKSLSGGSSGITGGSSKSGTSKSKTNSSTTSSSGTKKITNAKSVVTTTTKNNTSSQPTVDMKSVLALGYGPISASRLDELIRQGIVAEYVQNGKIKYKKVVKKYGF